MSKKAWAMVFVMLLMLAFAACGDEDPVTTSSAAVSSARSSSRSSSSVSTSGGSSSVSTSGGSSSVSTSGGSSTGGSSSVSTSGGSSVSTSGGSSVSTSGGSSSVSTSGGSSVSTSGGSSVSTSGGSSSVSTSGGSSTSTTASTSGGSSTGGGSSASVAPGTVDITGTVTISADVAAQSDGTYLPGVVFTANYTGNVADATLLRYQWEIGGQAVAEVDGGKSQTITATAEGVYYVVVTAVGYTASLGPALPHPVVMASGSVAMTGTVAISVDGVGAAQVGCTLKFAYTGGNADTYDVEWFLGFPGPGVGDEDTLVTEASGEYYVVLTSTTSGVVGTVRGGPFTVATAPPSGTLMWAGAGFTGEAGQAVPRGGSTDGTMVYDAAGQTGTCAKFNKTEVTTGNNVFYVSTDYTKRDTAGTFTFWYKGSWKGTVRILLTSNGSPTATNRSIDLAASGSTGAWNNGGNYTGGSFTTAQWTKVSLAYDPGTHTISGTATHQLNMRIGAPTGTPERAATDLCFDEFRWE